MSILLGKIAIKLSRLMGHRGTDVGGRTALKFNKNIFKKLIKNVENVIIITGTNGKSTVTNIVANVLEMEDETTISNKTGANMYSGLVSCMVENYRFFNNKKIKYAVFEVDEGNVQRVMSETDNSYLVITNFFRDQLDRYSEMDLIIEKIRSGLSKEKVKLVINVDDPFCMRFNDFNYEGYGLSDNINVFKQAEITDSKYCPSCGKELIYDCIFYSQLGHYKCDCGFYRTKPKYLLEELANLELVVNNYRYNHNLLGKYNSYNILAAISILKELHISNDLIEQGLKNYYSNDGRMQLFRFNDKKIYLNLVKNPAGMNMSLQEVATLKPKQVCFIVNDAVGDGVDVSWLWDADFEVLLEHNIEKYYACGTRAYEVALRLKNMGVDQSKIMVNPLFETLIPNIISEDTLVCCSYTALNETKVLLQKKEASM